jgi:hypothetical protein
MTDKSDKPIIYIITKGCYSDYHICAATTDKGRAEQLRELFYNDGTMYPDDVNIEEFRDGTLNDMIDRGYEVYRVGYDANYRPESVSLECRSILDRIEDNAWNVVCKNGVGDYWVYVQARDEDHARKIAQDIMTEYRYRKEIGEN